MKEPVQMNLHRMVCLEDSKLKDIPSINAYIEELQWVQSLIEHHINRCKVWKLECPAGKVAYGKLNDFLVSLEA